MLRIVVRPAVIFMMLACLGLAKIGNAQPVTFRFTGTVVDAGGASFGFIVGQSVSVNYTFESSTPDFDPTVDVGVYSAVSRLSLWVPGTTTWIEAAPNFTPGPIQVLLNIPSAIQQIYQVTVLEPDQTLTGPALDGNPDRLTIFMESSQTTALSGEALPATPPNLSDFDVRTEILVEYSGGTQIRISLDSLTLSGPAYTDASGQEWRQVTETMGLSWNDLNAACPGGVCTGTAGAAAIDVDGWMWATITNVADLFNEFIDFPALDGTVGFYTESESTWAPAFLDLFDFTQFATGNDGGPGVGGWSATSSNATEAFSGGLHDVTAGPGFPDSAGIGSSDKTFTGGAWMYRPAASVPPSAQISALVEDVNALESGGTLTGGQANGLTAQLDAALALLPSTQVQAAGGTLASTNQIQATDNTARRLEGQTKTAANILSAFVRHVAGFVRVGVLSVTEGQPLIGAAQSIIADLLAEL